MIEAQASEAGGGRPVAEPTVRRAGLWNIANILTMVRLLLVPVLVLLMTADGGHDPVWRSFAGAAFTIAMITDLFDGELARRYDLVTDFGKIADPIADKAIMGAALVCLSVLSDLPWWVTGAVLSREVGITLMRFWVIKHAVIPASRGGKLKTLAQGIAVGMYLLPLTGPLATLRWWVMAVAVVLTIGTGFDYVRQAVALRRNALSAKPVPARPRTPSEVGAGAAAGSPARTGVAPGNLYRTGTGAGSPSRAAGGPSGTGTGAVGRAGERS